MQYPVLREAVEPAYVMPLLQQLADKSAWTYLHSIGTGLIIVDLHEYLNSQPSRSLTAQRAAVLHDVGKVMIADYILNKEGALTDEEFTAIQHHPRAGFDLVKEHDGQVAKILVGHHEHQSVPYPRGFVRSATDPEILFEQRLLAIADTVDALLNTRPYKPHWSLEAVREELEKKFGNVFDAKLLDQAVASGMQHRR